MDETIKKSPALSLLITKANTRNPSTAYHKKIIEKNMNGVNWLVAATVGMDDGDMSVYASPLTPELDNEIVQRVAEWEQKNKEAIDSYILFEIFECILWKHFRLDVSFWG